MHMSEVRCVDSRSTARQPGVPYAKPVLQAENNDAPLLWSGHALCHCLAA